LAGNGPAAIDINSVRKSRIENNSFLNNTGAFSFLEEEYGLPFYEVLSMRSNHLNYIWLNGTKEKCGDEIKMIGNKNCYLKEPYVWSTCAFCSSDL